MIQENKPLNITMAQINPIVGDVAYNRNKIIAFSNDVTDETDLIVFSELTLSGYPPDDLAGKPAFLDAVKIAIADIAEATKHLDCGIIFGAPIVDGTIRDEGHERRTAIYNCAVFLHQGQQIACIKKHRLANYDEYDEKRVFIEGPMPEPIDFKDHRLGIIVCKDMWHDDIIEHMAKQGSDILISMNGSTFTTTKHKMRIERIQELAKRTSLPIAYINQVGGQDEMVFDGGSFVLNDKGELTAQAPFFEECLLPSSPELVQPIVRGSSEGENQIPAQGGDDVLWKALTTATHDYVTKNGFSKVLLGLSGGIDSALVAAIAADALGKKNVQCIMLPSEFTSQDNLEDAKACAENLGCNYEIIDIKAAVKTFEHIIPDLSGLAHENTQSRIRGLILMALSNARGSLLLSTGNKSEMAVGYATLYGDMNGAFNPIKDIYKTKIYELAQYRDIQPSRILTKAPSAELKAGQTDQDSLPDYHVLDSILKGLIEKEESLEDLIDHGFDKEMVLNVWTMLDRAEYKRFQAPPGPKITRKAFGRCRRYPLTNGFYEESFKPKSSKP